MADTFSYNWDDPFREDEDNFHISRAVAIQEYARLEQALSGLLATFGELQEDVAWIIFFKIVNSRTRLEIIERLKKRKIGDKHNLYFNSLISGVGQLDATRNSLIHWHEPVAGAPKNEDRTVTKKAILWNPKSASPGDNPLTHADIIDFTYKADFYQRAINIFRWSHEPGSPMAQEQPWLEIFEQPLVYPPQADHPLFRTRRERPTPPEPSQA